MGKVFVKKNNEYKYFASIRDNNDYELVKDVDVNKIRLEVIKDSITTQNNK